MTVVAGDGRQRDMVMVESHTIPMWLATIDENEVNEESRDKLIAYPRKAVAAIDAYRVMNRESVSRSSRPRQRASTGQSRSSLTTRRMSHFPSPQR